MPKYTTESGVEDRMLRGAGRVPGVESREKSSGEAGGVEGVG